MSLSYLVSTAGHAQAQNDDYPHDITSITQLIREGARELGDRSVVGFAVPSTKVEGEWECERYCKYPSVLVDTVVVAQLTIRSNLAYKQLIQLSQSFAQALLPQLGPLEKHERGGENQIVSLLCPTGIDFLVAWIGCMGLGLGVVFVASVQACHGNTNLGARSDLEIARTDLNVPQQPSYIFFNQPDRLIYCIIRTTPP
jgi:acyl-CoA synthetase (AMP-forming)/AMP-acid ligase II